MNQSGINPEKIEEAASSTQILIVDDESSVRDVLQRLLSSEGYTCRTATCVEAAISALESAPADLVLSDIMMPGGSGIDLLQKVRWRWPDTIMMMITAVASAQTAIDAMRQGAEDYIIKPFNLTEVHMAVGRALEKRNLLLSNRDYRKSLEKKVEEQTGEIRSTFLGAIKALAEALETKDPYTNGHSRRVTELTVTMAKKMGLPREDVEKIRLAGMLHDIGKIGVPEDILHKPGKLTALQFSSIQEHSAMGEKILMPIIKDPEILEMVRCHHERFDGRGYPDGLAGKEIPIGARLMAVADAYDAMTSNRPYREAMPPERAREQLLAGKGSQFDPAVVDLFIKVEDCHELPFCPVSGRPFAVQKKAS